MSADIAREAAHWVARLDRGLSAEEAEALARWRASDPRCEGAFVRAQAMFVRYDRAQALGAHYDPKAFRGPLALPTSRRNLLWAGGGALAASLVGAAILVGGQFAVQIYSTKRGEVRLVSLSDGSRLTLDAGSKVSVRYSDHVRELHLVEGEALFDVAKNRTRPFIVDAGDLKVRAVGTSFSVRRLPGQPTQVVVREGLVDIIRTPGAFTGTGAASGTNGHAAGADVRLAANEKVVASAAGPIAAETLSPTDLEAALAWKDGMIAFKHTTLGQAAKEFARYSATPIVIDDPSLANEKVTGLYSASDPVGFAQAAALGLQVKTRFAGGAVHLYR